MTTGPVGNYFDKQATRHPLERLVVRRFDAAVETRLRGLAAGRILDLGCGEGNVTRVIRRLNPRSFVVACDVSPAVLAANAAADARAVTSLPTTCFADASFDLVVMLEVLEHVDDPDAALDEVRRVGGSEAVISVPHEPVWRALNMARGRYLSDFGNTPGHVNHFTPWSFARILRRHFPRTEIASAFPWLLSVCRAK